LAPDPGESLRKYAARLAVEHGIKREDVVGGTSFGGMLAAEIAQQRQVAGLVLLGSCWHPDALPPAYAWIELLSRLTPDFILGVRRWESVIRWRFAPVTDAAVAVLAAMERDCPTEQLRQFGRMIAAWPGTAQPNCPTLVIHGKYDRLIPAARIKADILLDAGHVFTLTHPNQTKGAIAQFLELIEE
jgi:pimeloyl-ACP methyl ester carboxylesterase